MLRVIHISLDKQLLDEKEKELKKQDSRETGAYCMLAYSAAGAVAGVSTYIALAFYEIDKFKEPALAIGAVGAALALFGVINIHSTKKRKKERLDIVSAQIMLQSYMQVNG